MGRLRDRRQGAAHGQLPQQFEVTHVHEGSLTITVRKGRWSFTKAPRRMDA
ncbi:hypothetical protein BJY21_001896 [Kineosphaera limosa]|nr:hypothetical protein [Kineosphaera limosa]